MSDTEMLKTLHRSRVQICISKGNYRKVFCLG